MYWKYTRDSYVDFSTISVRLYSHVHTKKMYQYHWTCFVPKLVPVSSLNFMHIIFFLGSKSLLQANYYWKISQKFVGNFFIPFTKKIKLQYGIAVSKCCYLGDRQITKSTWHKRYNLTKLKCEFFVSELERVYYMKVRKCTSY